MLILLTALPLPFLLLTLNLWRSRKSSTISLIPNCLLTRYPIVFVRGRPSPFYFLKYWNSVPEFLGAHGYEVKVLPKSRLGSLTKKVHLIHDSTTKIPGDWFAENQNLISTTTAVGDTFLSNTHMQSPWPWTVLLSLHNLWIGSTKSLRPSWLGIGMDDEIHKAFLNYAISLAENDLKCSH